MTRNEWLRDFYGALSVPHTTRNARAGIAWMQTEGGSARWNPLNTTKRMPGSTDYNSVGVQNYPDFDTGLAATLSTIRELGHGYETILKRLHASARPRRTCKAIDSSAWGTGGLILRVLRDVERDYWRFASTQVAGS